MALFLAVLYEQRQANTAYMAHSTLADVLVPSTTSMGSTDDVYNWLSTNVLTVSPQQQAIEGQGGGSGGGVRGATVAQ